MKTKFTRTKNLSAKSSYEAEDYPRKAKNRTFRKRAADDFYDPGEINITQLRNIDVQSLFSNDEQLFA